MPAKFIIDILTEVLFLIIKMCLKSLDPVSVSWLHILQQFRKEAVSCYTNNNAEILFRVFKDQQFNHTKVSIRVGQFYII